MAARFAVPNGTRGLAECRGASFILSVSCSSQGAALFSGAVDTDYDSNDTALAKVKAGGQGFDIVVPSASFVPIWISERLVEETRPDLMENFKNVDPRWIDVPFDKGRRYSVPWQWVTMR